MAVFDSFIGLLAPPLCVVCEDEGSALCQICATTRITPYGDRCFDCGAPTRAGRTCQHCHLDAPTHVWLSTNYEDAARELVKVYKFGHQRTAAKPITKLMLDTLLQFANHQTLREAKYLVVPIPTASSRVRQRGFDHSSLLAKQIAGRLGLQYRNSLCRIGQSQQVGAERSMRLRQPIGKYRVHRPSGVVDQNILLIDDVITTGATLRAATKALRGAGASRVDALAFAKRL